MVFEPVEGCEREPCDLMVTEGPELLAGVVMSPVDNGSEYVGDQVHVLKHCAENPVPVEVTRGTLTARRSDDDALEFVITSEMTEAWGGCDPWSSDYRATATRES